MDNRAQAYMQMVADPASGWNHLRKWMEEKIELAAKAVMLEKYTGHWLRSNDEDTDRIYRKVVESQVFQCVIRHVEEEIAKERKAVEKANQRDSQA